MPSGLSLGGDEYFYQNPLANDGSHRRQKWFGCACCPPNIARLIAQLPGYFYSVSHEGIWVNFFGQNEAEIPLLDGEVVKLKQQTQYPWRGVITFQIESAPEREWSLFLRIPEWAKDATLKVWNETYSPQSGEFFEIKRVWNAGDTVTLDLPMETRFVRSHPNAMENTGRVAVMRGPLLYCAEGEDYPEIDLRWLEVSEHQVLEAKSRPELLGGIITLEGEGSLAVFDDEWNEQLYTTESIQVEIQPASITLIPYYAWANRGPKQMQVWLREG